jgi:hypothetical protein
MESFLTIHLKEVTTHVLTFSIKSLKFNQNVAKRYSPRDIVKVGFLNKTIYIRRQKRRRESLESEEQYSEIINDTVTFDNERSSENNEFETSDRESAEIESSNDSIESPEEQDEGESDEEGKEEEEQQKEEKEEGKWKPQSSQRKNKALDERLYGFSKRTMEIDTTPLYLQSFLPRQRVYYDVYKRKRYIGKHLN